MVVPLEDVVGPIFGELNFQFLGSYFLNDGNFSGIKGIISPQLVAAGTAASRF